MSYPAVSDHDVLDGPVHAQPVCIAAGFQADCVIVALDVAARNQHVARRINVYAVRTGRLHRFAVRPNLQAANLDAVAVSQL